MMQNWSGNQRWEPTTVSYPGSEEEIAQLVQQARTEGNNIRTIGSGHSFTALNNTSDILVSLDQWQGIIEVHTESLEVSVKAGTKLHLLGQLLHSVGLAMENLGDIDEQSIAGAISTGTHGTGVAFGNISTQISGISFIDGTGELVHCSLENKADLFRCMQISLGSFGIITRIRLRCVAAYRLSLEKRKEPLDQVLENYPAYNRDHRNFEFYWLPYTNTTQTKFTNITEEAIDQANWWTYVNDVWIENYVFMGLCELAKQFPRLNQGISRFSARFLGESRKVSYSHQVYATPRYVKFNEMEYNIPLVDYLVVFREAQKIVNSSRHAIHFPIENRFVKGDDIWLSPAYQRDSAYIACHVYKGKAYEGYFRELEELFIAYEGRPHWGKLHFQEAEDLRTRYPLWDDFLRLRAIHDPQSVFLNPYLKQLFGLTS